MTEPTDRWLHTWLLDGPELGPESILAQAIATSRTTAQRPGWTLRERWLPMELTMERTTGPRPVLIMGLLALILAAIATTALLAGSKPRLPDRVGPAANGRIAYASGGRIFLLSASGDQLEQLSTIDGLGYAPAFSADGSRVAFLSRADADATISLSVAAVDGTGRPIVVSGELPIVNWPSATAAWSPDGTQLAFTSADVAVDRVYVASSDGRGITWVSPDDRSPRVVTDWSPDGSWLSYQQHDMNTVSLMIAHPDGTDPSMLTSAPHIAGWEYQDARWSPDGDRLLYTRTEGADYVIATVDLAGHETVLVGPAMVGWPEWAPDGDSIVYLDEDRGVVLIGSDGTDERVLTDRQDDCGLGFSPDGGTILGSDCHTLELIPVDGPSRATIVEIPPMPGSDDPSMIGAPSWQRLAP